MKCPYCRNEIPNNSIKCEICGVDLEQNIKEKKQYSIVSIVLLVFGLFMIGMGIVWMVIGGIQNRVFPNNPISKTLSLMNLIPFVFGTPLTIFGIYGLISNRNLKEDNTQKNKFGIIMFCIILVIFLLILSVVVGMMGENRPDRVVTDMSSFIIGLACAIVLIFVFAVAANMGKKK